MSKTITELTIKRSEWLRGVKDSKLLIVNGKMCCLGFFCMATGLKRESILKVGTPFRLATQCPEQLDRKEACEITWQLMKTNDTASLDDIQREKELKEKFLLLNPPVVVTFVD